MRWRGNPFEWKHHFCLLPIWVGDEWIWLEWIERRFCGDCYEVRHVENS